jgi:hypothetical protein
MKRILSLFAIVFTLLIGTQNLSAQEQSIEEYANQKATALQEQFNLTENQKSAVYRAFYSKKINYQRYLNGNEADASYEQNKNKVDMSFNHIMKRTLGEEDYNIFVAENDE